MSASQKVYKGHRVIRLKRRPTNLIGFSAFTHEIKLLASSLKVARAPLQ